MKKLKSIIVIPTYMEADVIEETVKSVFHEVSCDNLREWYILIFDSASTDGTDVIVRTLQKTIPNLLLLSENQKTGLGSAYSQALKYAATELNADLIFEFDADLSHQPKYLISMANELEKCDVVVGSRYVKGGSIPSDWQWHRKFLSKFGNLVIRYILTKKYKDFTSGFRAAKGEVYRKLLPPKFLSNGYSYKIHLLWLLHQEALSIKEFPIEFVDRKKGKSKLPSNSIKDTFKTLFLLRLHDAKKFLRMAIVGLYGVFLQLVIYRYLRHFLSPFFSTQLAVFITMLNNYIWHHKFTFKSVSSFLETKRMKFLLIFITYSSVMIFLQASIMSIGVKYFGVGKVQENLIMIFALSLTSIINYYFYSKIIWRNKID